ncbi:VTT domain-containing protein [Streptomyces durbertensis]|uniref:TVP38/TMEM64 family membrane protein n=1 Tax=Streptomyces durbertensis TaxID=2448886 RepID=A0ABR6EDB3_9ACTN|nr:VTT domain-containing protein [Streptomyces durbertensis]MBB1243320.1 VTT domain-containing protein [Streptomyces durbertensis]
MPAPSSDPVRPPAAGPRAWRRLCLLVALLAAAWAAVTWYEPHAWLTGGTWGDSVPTGLAAPLFALLYAVAAALFVPRPLLGLAAGALFGSALGVAAAVAGTVLGAGLCLAVGRALGRDAVRPLLRGRRLAAVDRQLSDHGFRSVLLLRLLPGVPFAASNYAASFSRVRWPVFLGATALGGLPYTLVYALAGSRAGEPVSPVFLAVLGLAAAAGVLGAAAARRHLAFERGTAPAAGSPDGAGAPAHTI